MTITRTVIPAQHGWTLCTFASDREAEFSIGEPEDIIAWIITVTVGIAGSDPVISVDPVNCVGDSYADDYLIMAPRGRVTIPFDRDFPGLTQAEAYLAAEWKRKRAAAA